MMTVSDLQEFVDALGKIDPDDEVVLVAKAGDRAGTVHLRYDLRVDGLDETMYLDLVVH